MATPKAWQKGTWDTVSRTVEKETSKVRLDFSMPRWGVGFLDRKTGSPEAHGFFCFLGGGWGEGKKARDHNRPWRHLSMLIGGWVHLGEPCPFWGMPFGKYQPNVGQY